MKIHEMYLVEKNKWGRLLKNGVSIEPHEEKTAKFLIRLGLNIDLIRPNNTPKMNNPDFLMSGTIWE